LFYRRRCYMFLMIKRVDNYEHLNHSAKPIQKHWHLAKVRGQRCVWPSLVETPSGRFRNSFYFLYGSCLACNVEKLASHIDNDYNIRNLPNFIFSPIDLAFLLPKPAPRPINLRI
jgi:hypothetical protein